MDLAIAVKRLERYEELMSLMKRFDAANLINIHAWPRAQFLEEIQNEMNMLKDSFENERILVEVRKW